MKIGLNPVSPRKLVFKSVEFMGGKTILDLFQKLFLRHSFDGGKLLDLRDLGIDSLPNGSEGGKVLCARPPSCTLLAFVRLNYRFSVFAIDK